MVQTKSERPVILYFGGFLLPDKNASAHRVTGNAKIFRMLGYDTRIIGFQSLSGGNIKYIHSGEDSIQMAAMGITQNNIPLLSSYRINPVSVLRYIKRLSRRKKVSHVICYNYPSFAQAAIQLYCKLHKIHYISDVTEWNTKGGLSLVYRLVRAADINIRIHLLNHMATSLITTSPYMTKFYGGPKQGIGEIPTLFDKKKIMTQPSRHYDTEGQIRLIFIGPGFNLSIKRPHPDVLKERIDIVLRMVIAAIEMGRNIHLDIFGIEQAQCMDAFPDDAPSLEHHAKHLTFHGFAPHQHILKSLHESHFSILLRDNKRGNNAGFPTKFAESLLTGTPVIINDIQSIAKYHDHPHVLKVKGDSPEDMASQLLDQIMNYYKKENETPSQESSYQTFHYANFKNEMAKTIYSASEARSSSLSEP